MPIDVQIILWPAKLNQSTEALNQGPCSSPKSDMYLQPHAQGIHLACGSLALPSLGSDQSSSWAGLCSAAP